MNTDPTGYFAIADFSAASAIQGVLNSMTTGVSLQGIMTLLNVVCTVYDVSQAVWQVINGEGSVMEVMAAITKGIAIGYLIGYICDSPLGFIMRPLCIIFGIQGQYGQLMDALESGDPLEVTIRFLQLVTMIYGVTQQCFTGETLVSTEDGLRRIEDIKVGDYVWSEDVETGEQKLQKVLSVSISQTDTLVHVKTSSGEVINATTGHPFYVEERGWTIASELQVGDILRTQDGEVQTVVDVTIEKLDEPVLVYNLEVEDGHTYYVTDEKVLVHNMCEAAKENSNNQNLDDLIKRIPEKYKQNLKCMEFADEMEKLMLKNGVTGERISIFSFSRKIWSNKYGLISDNGNHDAIKIGNVIYDNLNPQGIDYNEWLYDLGMLEIPWDFASPIHKPIN